MEYEKFISHFPEMISKALVRYVTDTVLAQSRYLFIRTSKVAKGIQSAYCTHCQKQHFPDIKLKHKQDEKVKCPHCKSMCEVRAAGLGRSRMVDKAVLVWYEKSVIDPQAIIARVIDVRRDYSGSYLDVKTEYCSSHQYLFLPGSSTFFTYGKQAKSVHSAFDRYFSGYGNYPKFMSTANIRRAVKGTPFQYSTWETYTKYKNHRYVTDMTEFFDMAARYPCVEYLTKSGFDNLVWAKLYKDATYGAVNWRGKNLQKVLRLDKAELKELRQSGLRLTALQLRFYQRFRSKGLPVSLEDAKLLGDLHVGQENYLYKTACEFAPEATVLKYLLKQLQKEHYTSEYRGLYSVLNDWRDYRGQCEQLGMSLKEDRYLLPNDLHREHAKLTKRIRIKRDEEVDRQIKSRLAKLKKYEFHHNGLLIRAAESSEELFEEGKALKHCVGGYANRYAAGEMLLLVIRRASDPDKPFYTMEVREHKVMQCRGLNNKSMTTEVNEFVDQFIAKKLLNKKRTRVEVTQLHEGVAV
ncbi:PcfJ domain-containing protein [Paenibacillus amylolyticus]|nr:PcfJ domain-containing protein [Paenibacillus amylolyticus]WFR64286.1 PcfJ domain-containing protein [Paenibacillus amylolyticus]